MSGIPQYVWSKHHAYHHATNGNWDKYRGPLAIKSVAEYEALNAAQQLGYQRARNIWLAPAAGYLEAEKRFRKIQGVRELWVLSAALGNN
jgi:omega-6 fatty acid desaturase (delta-12 desaturase)